MAKKPEFFGTRQRSDIGKYAFLGGFAIAIVVGLVGAGLTADATKYLTVLLVFLGILVGLFNIGKAEETEFLVAAIALGLGANLYGFFNTIPEVGAYVVNIFSYVTAFVAPAAAIVALVVIWRLGRATNK